MTKIIQKGNLFPDKEGFRNRTAGRVYSIEGLAPTLRTPSGGGYNTSDCYETYENRIIYS